LCRVCHLSARSLVVRVKGLQAGARRLVRFVFAFLAAGGPLAVAGSFPPSETIFPDTTRAWLSLPDIRGLEERFDRTSYGQLVADPQMKAFVDGLREQISKNGRQRLAKLGLTVEDLGKVPGGEVAAAAIEAQPGVLSTVLVVDTTGHEAEAKELVDRIGQRLLEQKAKKVVVPNAPPQLTVYQLPPEQDGRSDAPARDRRVAFAQAPAALVVGDDALQVGQAFAVLAQGRKDSLATNPSFKASMARCGKEIPLSAAPVRWFIEPLGFAKAYQASNPPREKRKGPDYVAIMGRQGFDAIKGAGGILAFDHGGHSLRHHTLVHAPALPGRDPFGPERFDLAARMLRFPDAEGIAPPAWAPREIAGWTALQWDIETAFHSVETLFDDIVGEKGTFDDVIASLKEEPDGPQIDLEKDMVDCLGKRVVMLTHHVDPITTDSERLVIAIEATDPKRVAATVGKTMAADSDMQKIEIAGHEVWELIDRSMAVPQLEIETPGGAVKHADGHEGDEDSAHRRRQRLREKDDKLLPHSAVTVAHGHLLIASHRDILERVLVAPGGPDALAAAADYKATAAELARLLPGKAAVRSFGREDETIRPTYELLRQGSMPKSKSVFGQLLNGMLGDGKPGSVREQKIDGSMLPEFDKVRRYFGTTFLGMESTVEGWYLAGGSLPRPGQAPAVARKPEAPAGR
jgi:hypothetical protein